MRGSRPGAKALRNTIGAGLLVLFLLAAAACGSDSGDDSSKSATTATTAAASSLLGPKARAVGTPVKVGLITTGGDCTGCGNKDEAPASEATVAWLNEHMNGLAGHPITLDVCVDNNDAGKTSDCANKLIADDVVAVVLGTSGVVETSWKVLHDAKIPVINVSTTNTPLVEDSASTFVLNDPIANTVGFPIGIAKEKGVKKVSVIVVDLPVATDIYTRSKNEFKKAGLDLQVVPVALGIADMTPQAQRIVSDNPDGLVMIVGHDQFCIPALQGLQAAGFRGTIATISQCLTDATRETIPGSALKRMQFSSIAPIGDSADASMRQFQAVLDTYAKGKDIDAQDLPSVSAFQSFGALNAGTKNLTGAVTPASVIAALKAMKNETLAGSGDRLFRCNGKAAPSTPGVCSNSVLAGTLDAKGHPSTYTVVGNKPIPD